MHQYINILKVYNIEEIVKPITIKHCVINLI